MNPPVITVLLPAFNAAPFLGAAIESVLAQTCVDFELLVIDDGSTDSTRVVAAGFRDPRLRVLANERNLGLTATLNRGLREARGEFIARQDADDVSQPDRFARQLEFLRANPQVMLLGTSARQVDDAGRAQGTLDMPRSPLAVRWAMLFDNPFLHSAVMFRRAPVVAEFGGYDESFSISQDYELWSRIARRHPVANLPERLVTLRAHAGSLMRSRRAELDAETRRIQSAALAAEFPALAFSDREMEMLGQFRWKLEPSELPEFWRLFDRLLAAFHAAHDSAGEDSDLRASLAGQIGRVAYNLLPKHRLAALRTLSRAVRTSPEAAWRLPWARIAALAVLGDSARLFYEKYAAKKGDAS